jgi:glyoxylase-like metal-dependent hydrolase (beta-lactamase superfamily II)
MSEPRRRAEALHTVAPGVLHWSVQDDRIDFRSEAYAVATPGGNVLIDPLPLDAGLVERLLPVRAVCITGGFHQRSAWRLRRELRADVHAPRGAEGLLEAPDHEFGDGGQPVPGLTAIECHGPTNPHYLFRFDAPDRRSVLFCADLLMRGDDGPFAFVPDDHQTDPARTRAAARRLLDMPVDVLCPAHGRPLTEGVGRALRRAISGGEAG